MQIPSEALALLLALELYHYETALHCRRVSRLAARIGAALELGAEDLRRLELAALLHDIGKLGVPKYVLLKPGKLTDEEWGRIKQHPAAGARLALEFPYLADLARAIRFHHERWDGSGYPCGLRGAAVPLPARIIAVADALDVITAGRPYRAARSWEFAIGEIALQSGAQFAPAVVSAAVRIPLAEWEQLT